MKGKDIISRLYESSTHPLLHSYPALHRLDAPIFTVLRKRKYSDAPRPKFKIANLLRLYQITHIHVKKKLCKILAIRRIAMISAERIFPPFS